MQLATWGKRLGAWLLDYLILSAVSVAIFAVASLLSAAFRTVSDGLAIVVILMGMVGYLGVSVWFMLLEAGPHGQTPGKAIVGIRVVDTAGLSISRGRSVGRFFAKILSAMPFYLGFLWPLWDAERRTFHDMLAGTRVIDAFQTVSVGQALKGPWAR